MSPARPGNAVRESRARSGRRIRFLLAVALAVSALVYLPGRSGPWLFDDRTNITRNSYIQLESLDAESLRLAAFSLEAGPLQRPVAMLSFALNSYFAGGVEDPTPFKITNIALHALNGVLLFAFLRLLFARLGRIGALRGVAGGGAESRTDLLAAAVALLWLVHPIQLTSVLYVVQRMTELSALFTLLGLIFYLKGRERLASDRTAALAWILSGLLLWGGLGILSKENAVLLPVFMLLIEATLYSTEFPWRSWARLTAASRYLLIAAAISVVVLLVAWAVLYSLPHYAVRHFTMTERALTETRVLFFYLSLILLPQIHRLGHQHDDLEISQSLLQPWTTLPSLAGVAGLVVLAVVVRKKSPLLSLGILWFFAGHLLESTILSLEIAHEHRNYLPSLGVLLAAFHVLDQAAFRSRSRMIWLLPPVLIAVFAATTAQRAAHWSDVRRFVASEALHHPDSARTQVSLGVLLAEHGFREEAMQAARRAWELQPRETGFLLNMHLLAARQQETLGAAEQGETVRRLSSEPVTPTTRVGLANVLSCLPSWCSVLAAPAAGWADTLLDRSDQTQSDRALYYYAKGMALLQLADLTGATRAFTLSYETDRKFLHPLIALARIAIDLRQEEMAQHLLSLLIEANRKAPHPRTREIEQLSADLRRLRGERPQAPEPAAPAR